MSAPLILAIPSKGRLKEQVEGWLADCGLAVAWASFTDRSSPSEPGTQGMPKLFAVRLASILSPMIRMCSGLGPMKVMPWSPTISAKLAFSDRSRSPDEWRRRR